MPEIAAKNIESKRITIVEDHVLVARAIAEISHKAGHKTQVILAGLTERNCDPSKEEEFRGMRPINVILKENEVRAEDEEAILAAIKDFQTEILLLDNDLGNTRTSGQKIAQKLGGGVHIANISSSEQPYSTMHLPPKERLLEEGQLAAKIIGIYEEFFANLKGTKL